MKIDEVSNGHRTILRTQVPHGRKRITVEVSVIGRDLWAYQFAKIELQNRAIAAVRGLPAQPAALPPRATGSQGSIEIERHAAPGEQFLTGR